MQNLLKELLNKGMFQMNTLMLSMKILSYLSAKIVPKLLAIDKYWEHTAKKFMKIFHCCAAKFPQRASHEKSIEIPT